MDKDIINKIARFDKMTVEQASLLGSTSLVHETQVHNPIVTLEPKYQQDLTILLRLGVHKEACAKTPSKSQVFSQQSYPQEFQ